MSKRVFEMESPGMPRHGIARRQLKTLTAGFLVVLPAVIFYSILFRTAIDLPLEDDYEALLDFLNQIVMLKGISARASYLFAAQFNEYKLFFGHGIAWLQLALVGHVDFRLLCAIGNGFVLLLAILLWKMFLPKHTDLGERLLFFVPVSWLVFQLQYVETLNWAMPSLQNVPVIVFSFGAIYFLIGAGRRPFYGAIVCLILAVAASGNGFLVIPVGMLILYSGRFYARIAAWLLVSVGCVAVYAYRYNVMSSQSRMHHSVLSTMLQPRPLYVIAFMGSSAAFPFRGQNLSLDVALSCLAGILLCAFFVVLWRRDYFSKNPLVCCCVLFLLLTSIGVAGLRSDFGVVHSLDSRYTIYSVLLMIFAWYAVVEEFLQQGRQNIPRYRILSFVITGTVVFALLLDRRGWQFLSWRNDKIVTGMIAYEHPSEDSGVGPILPFEGQGARSDELDRHAPVILKQSTELGVYRPPAY